MPKRHLRVLLFKLAGICILIELCILSLLALIGWYKAWETVNRYGDSLFYMGLISVGIGLMSIKGYLDSTRSFGYQYSLTVGEHDAWQRTKLGLIETMENHQFMMIMLLTGAINMLLGWIIQT